MCATPYPVTFHDENTAHIWRVKMTLHKYCKSSKPNLVRNHTLILEGQNDPAKNIEKTAKCVL